MRRALRLLAPAVLLLAVACQPQAGPTVYGPWEEGLTLAFEDPSQAQPQRTADRLQVRVTRGSMGPQAPTQVQLDLANARGQISMLLRYQDGGTYLVNPEGQVLAQSLPAGFPAVDTWTDRETTYRVIGRAAWESGTVLPASAQTIGVWVEARPSHGPRRRTLYLPNLGEVETLVERDGGWVAINRLVACGFTDLPVRTNP